MAKASEYDYSEFKPEPGANILAQLRGATQRLLKAQADLAKAREEVSRLEAVVSYLEEKELPTYMEAAETTDWRANDGVRVRLVEQIFANIKKENQAAAFKWLEGHKMADIIKRQFTIKFGKDEEKWADKFAQDLAKRKKPVKVEIKRSVHPQTLNATVKEILSEGKLRLPLEVFGVFRRKVAEVEVPGVAKAKPQKKEE